MRAPAQSARRLTVVYVLLAAIGGGSLVVGGLKVGSVSLNSQQSTQTQFDSHDRWTQARGDRQTVVTGDSAHVIVFEAGVQPRGCQARPAGGSQRADVRTLAEMKRLNDLIFFWGNENIEQIAGSQPDT